MPTETNTERWARINNEWGNDEHIEGDDVDFLIEQVRELETIKSGQMVVINSLRNKLEVFK